MEYLQQKELTPVSYNSGGVKLLGPTYVRKSSMSGQLHWHDRMEILVVCEGELQGMIGKDVYHIRTGQIAIVNPGQLHGIFCSQEGAAYYVVMFDTANFFNGTEASRRLLKAIHNRTVSFHSRCADTEIVLTVQKIIDNCQSADPFSDLFVESGIYALLGQLYQTQLLPAVASTVTDVRFGSVLEYINLHFTEDLHSTELSRRFGYDTAYFSRRFKSLTGMSPSRYIRMLRLEYAQQMLDRRDMRVQDVAAKCGFADAGYFCRCYKAYYHISPTEYLAQNA
ncbi:MAG: helix-turn-helix transcriptional regulator [Oscillospiraceae bacterium]|nr:helix-turn-helix transcriptional regulator [Oscillospiraceae bacterium]